MSRNQNSLCSKFDIPFDYQADNVPYIKILAIGDTNCGKSTYLKQKCKIIFDDQKIKSKKSADFTCGCNIYILEQQIQQQKLAPNCKSISTQNNKNNKNILQFYDLSGDKNVRDNLNVYFQVNIPLFKAILFFFDLTNLRTLDNFDNWLITVFQNKYNNMQYNYVWEIPFAIIGTKSDQLNNEQLEKIKIKVQAKFKDRFYCNAGQNIFFISNELPLNPRFALYNKQLDLFLSEVSLEQSLLSQNKKFSNSEYISNPELEKLLGNSNKFCLNNSLLQNKLLISSNEGLLWSVYLQYFIKKFQQVFGSCIIKKKKNQELLISKGTSTNKQQL